MIDDLNTLLGAPLPEIADRGFSAKVMVRIEKAQRRDAMFTFGVLGLTALAAMPFLPIVKTVDALVPTLVGLALQPGLYIAAAAIALTLLADRELFQN
jgi:hypothetical protein